MLDFSALDGLKKDAPAWVWVAFGVACLLSLIGGDAFAFSPFLIFAAAVIGFFWYGSSMKAHNKTAYQAFADANHFTYKEDGSKDDHGPGTLFIHGHSPKTSDVITGTRPDGLAFCLFHHHYDTGSGKSRTTHQATVVRITLRRILPHMVIDSHVEGGANNSSVLPIAFDRSQRIELEGDFNKYFSCYAPDTYGVSLLTIIGPDAMWALMEHAAACDIEIIDNNLYFYWPHTANSRSEYETIFNTINGVLKEIGSKLTTADIYATKEQARVHASSANAQGVRLVSHKKMWGGLSAVIFVGIWVGLETGILPPGIYVFFVFAIIASALVLSLRRDAKTQALKDQLQRRFGK
ncbi:MAG TPA: hypothetical protein VLA88_04360 [Candidatus Saccharimonadales bacterium]|nr:hypothetical protein [Candidatus Saccharimonadales bacterium]